MNFMSIRRLLSISALALTLVAPTHAIALTGDAARFDFSGGVPAITSDNTTTCNNQATARFDFSGGVPAIVYDATATCTAAAGGDSFQSRTGGTIINTQSIINGQVIIP